MELNDSIVIPATPTQVFAALNDPAILRAAIPGCERLIASRMTASTQFVVLRVGPIKARFGGEMTMDRSGAPDHFSLAGGGAGGVAVLQKVQRRCNLRPTGRPSPHISCRRSDRRETRSVG
jgi:carbon monoxide dehydrogenase subunit G